MANLLIEVGNTALKAAWAEGMTLGKTFRFQGEKVMEFILSLTEKEKPEVMALVSAKPVTPEEEVVLRKECRHLMILDSTHADILQRYDLPDYLSYDRAASLLAVQQAVQLRLRQGQLDPTSLTTGIRQMLGSLAQHHPLVAEDRPLETELRALVTRIQQQHWPLYTENSIEKR